MGARVWVVPGQVSAAAAIDLLNRNAQPVNAQPVPARQALPGPSPTPTGELRGLLAQNGLDAGLSVLSTAPAGSGWTPSRKGGRAAFYGRFREYERVLGISFKIQPPQQAPELTSPSL